MIVYLHNENIFIRDVENIGERITTNPGYKVYELDEGTNFLSGLDIDDTDGRRILTIRTNNLCIIDVRG